MILSLYYDIYQGKQSCPHKHLQICHYCTANIGMIAFLADRINGRTYATVSRLSSSSVCRL